MTLDPVVAFSAAALCAVLACSSTTAPPQTAVTSCGIGTSSGSTLKLQATSRVPLGGRPYSAAVSSKSVAYISQLDSNTLAVATLPTMTFAARVAVGALPTEVAFSGNGNQAYVTNQFSQNVGVIDVAAGVQTATIPVSGNPFAVIVVPGDDVYVTTTADSLFGISSGLSIPAGTIRWRLSVPSIANGMAVCDSMLYVSTRDVGIVTEINMKRDSIQRTFPVGGQPQGIVIAPSKTQLYIANQNGSLQFWDIPSNTGTAVPIAGPGFGLAQSPADGRLYVTTLTAGQVQVFDPATHAKVDSFMVGGTVRRIAFNPAGTMAVVANEAGWVDFLTTSSPPTTRVLLAARPYSVAVSATNVAYVSLLDAASVAMDSLPSFAFPTLVSVGDTPTEVAFNSTGTRAYVTNQFSQSVGVIDVASRHQTTTIPVSGNPFAVLVAPGDSIVYVTTTADSLFGIQTATATITRRLFMPSISNGMAMRDSLLYVSTRDAGTVTEVNTKTNVVLRTFAVGGQPQGIVLSATGAELYIANQSGSLQFWNVTTNQSEASVPLAGGGFGLATNPANGRLYVTTLAGGRVQVFDPVTRAQVDSVFVGGTVRRIAFNPAGTIAVVANDGGWVDFLH